MFELEPGAEFESHGKIYSIMEIDYRPAEGNYPETFTIYAEHVGHSEDME